MKGKASLESSVNKEDNSIVVKREFQADLRMVWEAWTDPELLDQWWAPKPYHIETKSLNFEEGGRWLYAMVSPKKQKNWCKADYKSIERLKSITWLDAFCDPDGNETAGKPRSLWTIVFSEQNGITTVIVTLQHENLVDLEMMIKMGFKEGFSMALANLDQLLALNRD